MQKFPRFVTFSVPGLPAPQGSKDPKRNHRTGKIVLVEHSPRHAAWRDSVTLYARRAWKQKPLLVDVPVFVQIEFILPRAKSLGPDAITPPAIKRVGDIDKLERAVYDGLTGAIIADDSIIIRNRNRKRIAEFGEPTGAIITVEEMSWPKK